MDLHLTESQFRRLLDLVYVGNFIMNDIREEDRIKEYDEIESLIFSYCKEANMPSLIRKDKDGKVLPSYAYEEGGILEVIRLYEDTSFFELLAQELSIRDCDFGFPRDQKQLKQFQDKVNGYLDEFQKNGLERVSIEVESDD